MPLQLAEHCLLKEFTENHLVLWLDHSATNLQRAGLQQQVQATISQYFKREISVQWVVADLGIETPEQQRQQRKKRLQQLAIDSIYQDEFVQHLKQDFSATLIDASIRPKKTE